MSATGRKHLSGGLARMTASAALRKATATGLKAGSDRWRQRRTAVGDVPMRIAICRFEPVN